MILVTILFDVCWHRLGHYLDHHTYKFGDKGDDTGHEHKQLSGVLLRKVQGEFMGLGMLALLVFLCEKQGIFDRLAELRCHGKDCLHLPKT